LKENVGGYAVSGYDKKWFYIQNIISGSNYEYFYQKLSRPLEKWQTTPTGIVTQVENHCSRLMPGILYTIIVKKCYASSN